MTTLPFQVHSETSRAAAELSEKTVQSSRYRVYKFIVEWPGVTDEEIATGLNMNPSTARPRRIELEERRLIAQSGIGKTRSGADAVMYSATDEVFPDKWPTRRPQVERWSAHDEEMKAKGAIEERVRIVALVKEQVEFYKRHENMGAIAYRVVEDLADLIEESSS